MEESAIILEDKARTTVENAFLIRERLEELGIKEIILVTDDFHMRRAHFIFEYILHEEIDAEQKAGLEKVLAPVLGGRPLKLKLNVPCPCAIQQMENHAPIAEECKDAENEFEDSLPNSKMLSIIRKVLRGIPETIGNNAADKLHKSDSSKHISFQGTIKLCPMGITAKLTRPSKTQEYTQACAQIVGANIDEKILYDLISAISSGKWERRQVEGVLESAKCRDGNGQVSLERFFSWLFDEGVVS